jgi:hypothetical protein
MVSRMSSQMTGQRSTETSSGSLAWSKATREQGVQAAGQHRRAVQADQQTDHLTLCNRHSPVAQDYPHRLAWSVLAPMVEWDHRDRDVIHGGQSRVSLVVAGNGPAGAWGQQLS